FEIVDGNPDIDRIFFFNAPWLSRGGWKSSWKEVPSLITLLKRETFDIYYCLRADLVGNMIGFFAKIPQRVGFTNGGGGFFLTVAFNEAVGVHQTSVLLQLLGDFKGASKTASPVLALSHKEREKANTILKRYNLFGKKLVGIHLGAGYPSKIWSVDKFGTLIRKVFLEYGYTPIVVGGRDDKLIARGIHEVLDECEGVVLAGEVNLKGTAALLERCSLFIGNDSGPAHIAGALGIPAVVIFSMANSPERWHPCGGQVSLVYKDVPCKGCERSVCSDKRCLDLITAEDVFSEVSKVMVL
ncbi:MAG: glycosyltransferase family 9 protein, partial [Nitrospinota bacterium]